MNKTLIKVIIGYVALALLTRHFSTSWDKLKVYVFVTQLQ